MTTTHDPQTVQPSAAQPKPDPAPPEPAAQPAAEPGAPGRRPRRVWWISLFVFFLLPAAWAFIPPYDGAYDEHDHVVRAAGVVRGQVLVKPAYEKNDGGYQSVPASLVPPNFDCLRQHSEPATCLGTPPNDRTPREVHTRAARYNPVYYAVVGWPLLPLPTMAGVILARLLSALLCAVLLASALVTIWPLRRHRFMYLALLLAVSPMVLSLNGLVNPNGIEISAAILLWVALVRLLAPDARTVELADADGAEAGIEAGTEAGTDAGIEAGADAGTDGERRRLVVRAVVAAAIMVLARSEGIAAVAGICVFAAFALSDRSAVRALLRRADVRRGVLVVVAAVAASVAWLFVSRVGDIGAGATGLGLPLRTVLRVIVLGKFDFWVRQTVGLFGYGLIGLPIWVHVLWGMVQGFLVFAAFALSRGRRLAYTIVAIPVVCFLIGTAADVYMAGRVGWWMQGRYFLPLWVGMYFLAALAISTEGPYRSLPAQAVRRLTVVGLVVWAVALCVGLGTTVMHFSDGDASSSYPTGWQPPAGLAVPALLAVAGLIATGWLTYMYLRAADRDAVPTG